MVLYRFNGKKIFIKNESTDWFFPFWESVFTSPQTVSYQTRSLHTCTYIDSEGLVQKYGNIVDHWEPAVGKVDSEGVASSGGRMNVEYLPVGVTGAH